MSSAHPKPRLVPGFDIRSLPIGPTEAFLLSRVDGSAKVEDLALSTGLSVAEVQGHLERLATLGCVQLGDARPLFTEVREVSRPDPRRDPTHPPPPGSVPTPTSPSPPPTAAAGPAPSSASASSAPSVGVADTAPHAPSVSSTADPDPGPELDPSLDPALLDEAPDVVRGTKIVILNLHARLDDIDHYALLGVERDAEKKDIKAAYFALVNQFHADRFFGKELGSYKARIDRIFGAVTKAHDTLTRGKTRGDYDSYLRSREATSELESPRPSPRRTPAIREAPLSTPTPPRGESPRADSPRIEQSRATPVPTSESDPSPLEMASTGATSATPVPRDPSPGETPRPSMRPLDSDSARRMMARRLLGNTPGRGGESLRPPRAPAEATAEDVVGRERVQQAVRDDLLQRLAGKGSPADRYRQIADDAEASGNLASALNALRAVADLTPDDSALQERISTLQLQVDRSMADRFVEQGKYEEHDRQWDKAARSYERAARGKNSSELYARAADCKLRAGTDTRKAVELARASVNLGTENAQRHFLLARAYEAAGMTTSALGAAKRAQELDPKLDGVKALIKDLKK